MWQRAVSKETWRKSTCVCPLLSKPTHSGTASLLIRAGTLRTESILSQSDFTNLSSPQNKKERAEGSTAGKPRRPVTVKKEKVS